mgnify:CR=1 FL=1
MVIRTPYNFCTHQNENIWPLISVQALIQYPYKQSENASEIAKILDLQEIQLPFALKSVTKVFWD